MTLVIKNKNVSLTEGTKLFRDALVSEGTAYLIDLSNRGTTNNFDVKNGAIIKDLSREASEALGISAQGIINTNNVNSQLTSKKGFTADGITGSGAYGLVIPSLMDYLSKPEVQSHKILFNIWVHTGESGNARGFIRTWLGGSDWSNTSFRANISNTGNLTVTIGGAIVQDSGFFPLPNQIQRCAYLYQGVGNPVKVWVNDVYKGETALLATGFNAIGANIVIGKPEVSSLGAQAFYRFFVEDLTVSGRNENDVVSQDYDYVNAMGQYLGIEKRPFANL